MNWFEAQTLMETARNKTKGKPIANNTRLYERHDNNYEIRLHGNVIMIIRKDGITPLDGGWKTVTTKERLNRYLPNGFSLYQRDWVWYLYRVLPSSEVFVKDAAYEYNFDDIHSIDNDGNVRLI